MPLVAGFWLMMTFTLSGCCFSREVTFKPDVNFNAGPDGAPSALTVDVVWVTDDLKKVIETQDWFLSVERGRAASRVKSYQLVPDQAQQPHDIGDAPADTGLTIIANYPRKEGQPANYHHWDKDHLPCKITVVLKRDHAEFAAEN